MRARRAGGWYRLAVVILKPLLTAFTRRRWSGREHLPKTGPVIVVVNHISYVDPLVIAHFVHAAGRRPRFLAKAEVFRLPVVGRIIRGCGQIPVYRYTDNAGAALQDAVKALERGECVVIYPEGTVTKDPAYWPMRARTGIARLALDSGAPVVPIGQWGAQRILGRARRLRLLPRKTVQVAAGPVVDLSAYRDGNRSARVLREVTDLVMTRVREQVAELRGEAPPVEFFDPRRLTPVADARRSA